MEVFELIVSTCFLVAGGVVVGLVFGFAIAFGAGKRDKRHE